MFTSIYLLSFVASAVFSLILTRKVRTYATTLGWVQNPVSDRHIHVKPIPRLGGVAIYFSVLFVALLGLIVPRFLSPVKHFAIGSAFGILVPATLVFMLGVYDDLRPLGPYLKFGIQAFAGALLYFSGHGIQQFDLFTRTHALQSMIGLPLTVLWVLLITNAFNLIDGLDGLAAGSALFSTFVLFIASLLGSNPLVTFLSIVLAGAILGFLRYNFHPASIFMGDSGSLFVGFMLSALALTGMQKGPTMIAVSIPVLSFGLPILDVVLAVTRRFLRRQHLFTADGEHIHHRLLKQGLSQRQAAYALYAVSAGFGLLSLVLFHNGQTMALVLVIVGIGVWLGVQQLRYVEISELQEMIQRTRQMRRMLANNLHVRRGIESLGACGDFTTMCKLLQETLEPIGFDGVTLEPSTPAVFPDACLSPLKRNSNGSFECRWSDGASERAWELKLALPNGSEHTSSGYFTIFRVQNDHSPLVDLNLLSTEFRKVLGGAFVRAMSQTDTTIKNTIRHDNRLEVRASVAQ